MKVSASFKISDFKKELKEVCDMNSDYPLLIRCKVDSDYGTYNKNDVFAAKYKKSDDTYHTKPVVCFGKWMNSEDVEVIDKFSDES